MAQLILSNGETLVDQCWLDDARVTIGRAKGNRIAVNDPSVAETHASISHVGRDYSLEDLRGMVLSVNGSPEIFLTHLDELGPAVVEPRRGVFRLYFVDATHDASGVALGRIGVLGSGGSPGDGN